MYDLHLLGWQHFQQLCLAISREVLGQTVESFLDSKDGGRDGAFAGTWSRHGMERLSGRFVIQCKFTSKKSKNLRASDLSDEVEKAERLVNQGLCDCYILMSNAALSGSEAETIEKRFKQAGVEQFAGFGSDWICGQIRENKRLRMLVPRIYGLGDLSQILDERAYECAFRTIPRTDSGARRARIPGHAAHGFRAKARKLSTGGTLPGRQLTRRWVAASYGHLQGGVHGCTEVIHAQDSRCPEA